MHNRSPFGVLWHLALIVTPLGFLSANCVAAESNVAELPEVNFSRDLRPILSDKCFACHGPDEGERQGGFRLDVRDSALGEADSGETPIVPGDAARSELIRRIRSDDELEQMPPPESNKTLTAEEIAIIEKWIAAGAEWDEHWSLQPPSRPDVPAVAMEGWAITPIDRFVLARLEREGLSPAEDAEPVTQLRRATLDLTGLPPTPEETDAFLADDDPGAYERAVDRLLDSPRFGEHMARYWLDVARYADTHGLHLDNYREMWPYRDWVVDAFNANLPYDQFIVHQLAGDLLPDPDNDALVATGFNRCHVSTNEGGSIEQEVYVRNVVDRVDTFGTVFLGLTIGCTRCHDHKYDALTQEDYYSLFAFFNSLDGKALDDNRKDPPPVLRVPTEQQRQELAVLADEIAELERQQLADSPELDRQQVHWEQRLSKLAEQADDAAATDDAKTDTATSAPLQPNGTAELVLSDWHWVGPFGGDARYLKSRNQGPEGGEIDLQQKFELATGEQVGWKARPDWVDGKVHNDLAGDPAANFLYRTIHSPIKQQVEISLGSDDGIRAYLNGKKVLENFVSRAAAADQEKLTLQLAPGVNHLLLKIVNTGGPSGFYFAVDPEHRVIPGDIVKVIRVPEEQRTADQRHKLRRYFRNQASGSDEFAALQERLKAAREERAAVNSAVATTLIWREREKPRPAYILLRGEYDQQGEPVERRTPAVLPPLPPELPRDRLGLAKWLIDPQHPLTARVAVNRFWQQLFGIGLVKTVDDFGSQGDPPSHPELLDWLAVEFRDSGWDVKQLMRQIVTSAAYRQSARCTESLRERDPQNRLLARGPRFRLDAEMLRDQALFVSGLLVEELGGPSVKPPQPDGLWFAVGYSGSNTVRFKADSGPKKIHRRTLYTFIKRTAPPPQMSTFDGPSRESCIARRERTNTPLQALLLMNDPQYFEAARALASRTIREAGATDKQRAAYMFRLCALRQPTDEELADLVQATRDEADHFRQDPAAAKQLLVLAGDASGKCEPLAEGCCDPAECAAWTITANLLLNLDEILTKN